MATIHLDYVTFALLEPHDFSWLRRLGAVFLRLSRAGFRQPTVRRRTGRDQTLCQICGCPDDGVRRYAGGGGRQAAAGGRGLLALAHPALIGMNEVLELPNGFACVFDWFDGKGLHDLSEICRGIDKETDPRSGYYRYRHLPLQKRLRSP